MGTYERRALLFDILWRHNINMEMLDGYVKDGLNLLHSAALHNNRVAVTRLLMAGASVNIRTDDENKQTALHLAASKGHTGIAERLLGFGAALFVTDAHNRTAAQVADACGHHNVAALLKGEKYEPDTDWGELTPDEDGNYKTLALLEEIISEANYLHGVPQEYIDSRLALLEAALNEGNNTAL